MKLYGYEGSDAMALMTWNKSLSVGVDSMDDQHKQLVSAVNELHEAMMTGKSSIVMGPLLKSLIAYTHSHFVAEEALMTRAKYPRLKEHQGRHAQLTADVQDYVGRVERGEAAISADLMQFLRNWLVSHIQKEDSDYGRWIQAHGTH